MISAARDLCKLLFYNLIRTLPTSEYPISIAYYFPKSGYMLVLTRRKKLAVGPGTMHGFFMLRRSK